MIFNFRNIHDLVIGWLVKDPQLHEALKRVNKTLIDVSKFLNAPDFPVLKVGKIIFNSDRNQLNQSSAMTQSCRITHSISQAIVSGIDTPLVFDTDIFDTDDMHDTVVNNTRIIIKTAGLYITGMNAHFSVEGIGGPSSFRELFIIINNTDRIVLDIIPPSEPHGTIFSISTIYQFSQGDYIEAWARQDTGTSLDILKTDKYSPIFWAHRLS